MEKSVGTGLEPFIRKIPGMKQIDPKQCSPLVLAYVGDCVFDLIVKTMDRPVSSSDDHRLYDQIKDTVPYICQNQW